MTQATKVLLVGGDAQSSRCLDGSPFAVYVRDTKPGNDWLLQFDAGGWCYNQSDCYARSLTPLGSSSTWPAARDGEALEDDDCAVNPTFCGFNFAIIPYCDGFSQLGSRADPIVFSNGSFSANLWSRGLDNLDAALAYLKAHTSLAQARRVLLDGCSAGAFSAFHHIDRVAAALPGAPLVQSVADAGFFLDAQIVVGDAVAGYQPGTFYYRSLLAYYFNMHNGSAGVSPRCLADRPPSLAWQCALATAAAQYASSSIFSVQSQFDGYQMQNHFAPPWLPGVDPAWAACTGNASRCSPEQINALENQWVPAFRGALSLAGILLPGSPHGLFLHNCVIHCQYGAYGTIKIDGSTAYQAISAWHNGTPRPSGGFQWVDSVAPSSNPTCALIS